MVWPLAFVQDIPETAAAVVCVTGCMAQSTAALMSH